MKSFVAQVIHELNTISDGKLWAETFVERKMEFHRRFSMGLITSITHGMDFFDNVMNGLNGSKWDERGEYGDNFRKIITSQTT